MNRLHPVSGSLTVEITCADPRQVLEEITLSGISISNIEKKSELVYQFCILRKDFYRISQILNKREVRLVIVFRQGIYWSVKMLLCRPVLIFLLFTVLMFTCYLPGRILFLEAEGNHILSEQQILAAAEKCGITFGVSRKVIRSETLKNRLLSELPQLQWAGINTSGCRAIISVRERAETENNGEEGIVSNIVSSQDAFILSTTVTAGTALVQPGDSVIAGQTLISGYTDHGFLIRATRSYGEILGLTNRTNAAVMSVNYLQITGNRTVKRNISLLIRKKRINLWKDSRISDVCCGRMYEEYFVSLPGGFQLPIAVCVDRYVCYETQRNKVTEENAGLLLQQFADAYLRSRMTAGKILQSNHQLSLFEDCYRLTSGFICSEYIGKEQIEQIGDHNGKRN